jgi:beta-N-acetylhexosaminidase
MDPRFRGDDKMKACILDCAGTVLTADERAFFREVNPYGFILFARHCETPAQVRALTEALKESVQREDVPILIDQEGGRVARLKPPHWPLFPAAGALAALGDGRAEKAIYLNARFIAHELHTIGVNVDCAPVADLIVPGAHAIIGDRAYGEEPERVAALAKAMAQGLQDGGVLPVLKHIPGHGRAGVDSHLALPVVDAPLEVLRATDFIPFQRLRHLPYAMTAHVLYTAIDPERLATTSPATIRLIREELGFTGLLMSDDLSMKAMRGTLTERTRDALAAGCDLALFCNGSLAERQEVAAASAPLSTRAAQCHAQFFANLAPLAFDHAEARAELDDLISSPCKGED